MKSVNIFWNWFQDNQNEILHLMESTPASQNYHLSWLNSHLKNYCEQLELVLIFPAAEKTKALLLISVNGNEEYLLEAAAINAVAPKSAKWNFVTMLPKSPVTTRSNNRILNKIIQDINLKNQNPPDPNKDELVGHVIIHFKIYSIICNRKTVAESVRYLLKFVMKWKEISKINFVQVANSETIKNNIVELYDLDFYYDKLNNITDSPKSAK